MLTFQLLLSVLAARIFVSQASVVPRSNQLVVSKSPKEGQFDLIQKAVDALSKTTTEKQTIYIEGGKYEEQVFIGELKGPLAIHGETSNPMTYKENKVNIVHSAGQSDGLSNDETATLRVHTPNFSLYNVNVENKKGKGTQAVALSAQKEKQGYYGVSLIGYMDTLLAQTGTQLYAKSMIAGEIDMIFGQYVRMWAYDCDIAFVDNGGYAIASGRKSPDVDSWIVVDSSRFVSAAGKSVRPQRSYLGRPWYPYARAVVQKSELSSIIHPEGWREWSKTESNTENAFLAEYGNTGEGAQGDRANFVQKLRSPIKITRVLGRTYTSWVDMKYLSK